MLLIRIIRESFLQAFSSLKSNKLRSFLSLLGISIGIFCIISVLSAVNSLENSIKDGFSELGSDVIIVDKVPWGEDLGKTYWKYAKRPPPGYADFERIETRLGDVSKAAFAVYTGGKTIKYNSSNVRGGYIMGTTFDFPDVQNVEIEKGRYFTKTEYDLGSNKVILGAKISNELFGAIEPIGKSVRIFGQKFQVVGVTKEEGDNPFNFISYDEVTWISFNTAKKFINTKDDNRFSTGKILYVKAKPNVDLNELKERIRGALRSGRRLRPKEGDNFSLNEVSALDSVLDSIFGVLYIAGGLIGFFALVVGMVSVANIMFVSVKERTNIIGVKKALGAKKVMILAEFLIESIILCIIGGAMGLVMVVGILKIISTVLPFEIAASPLFIFIGVGVSIAVGVIAGIIPALQGARLDPVVAMRQ